MDTAQDLDEMVDGVSDYIRFCEDSMIPTKTVKVFANNNPWVTKELKELLNIQKHTSKHTYFISCLFVLQMYFDFKLLTFVAGKFHHIL